MLLTTCTHCLARFRVTPQQLNAKQGQVRCGRCRKVFNGFEALERHPDDDTGSRLLARIEKEAGRELLEAPDTPEHSEAPPPIAADPVPAKIHAEPAAIPAPETSPPPVPAASPLRRAPPPAYGALEEIPAPEPPARAWRLGVALLLVVLGVELAYAGRGELARRYPVLRPWLDSLCAAVGCVVPWPNNEAWLRLEDSELLEVPGKTNQIALGARIRNVGPAAQEYPHLELTLTDLTGQAASRRVLRPTDYLGRAVTRGEVLAAGAELAIQLRLETRQMKATGYELLLFYP